MGMNHEDGSSLIAAIGILFMLAVIGAFIWFGFQIGFQTGQKSAPTKPVYYLIIISTSSEELLGQGYSDLGEALNVGYSLVPAVRAQGEYLTPPFFSEQNSGEGSRSPVPYEKQ